MPFTITCACGRALQVQEEHVGKKVRCPACQNILTVTPPGGPPPLPSLEFTPVESARPAAPSAPPRSQPRKSHEIDYEIFGGELQLVEVELDPGETVIAEAGAMTYMEHGIEFEAKLGDGSSPSQGFFGKVLAAGKRMVTGESMFMTHFTNRGRGKSRVAFGAPYPGKIIPVDLDQFDGELICQKNAFLCAALGTQI